MDRETLINLEVIHAVFGRGIIVEADEDLHITVRFGDDPDMERRFSFPDAFINRYLTFANPDLQATFSDVPQNEQQNIAIDYYTVEYNGDTYRRNSRSFWTLNNEIVHDTLQRALNAEIELLYPIDTLNVMDLLWSADDLLVTGQASSASRYYEAALAREGISLGDTRYALPRLSSCYRKMGLPEKSIELLGRYAQPQYESVAFLTSVAAAYLDLGNVQAAEHFARRAYGLNHGHADEELRNLFHAIDAANN